ncbi:exodeoxyribonuclease III [Candidatus Uabimicrobium amorphum]|uniref:Exodeoxyribonuclease III n=1 Tax=Uabimicrobium amorphum TaxID=2596890 RepID=A0A5S9IPE7_UABAM|nr:exodeoxyribonuclease III [Candidatus Uabimicrobium amorphum]BBM85648.1 exodeoxyribonuclease III [Candidatus Uabimicrobium amorphum]
MKIMSWNVNGIRAAVKNEGLYNAIHEQNPDVICLQETKLSSPDQVQLELDNYPHKYWNMAEKKGYAGTAIFSKQQPISVQNDIGIEQHDNEGRVIACEFETFYLVTVYVPNAQRKLTRLDYRQVWDADFLKYLKKLEEKKPVVFCGDMNVAHQEVDLARPKTNTKNAGFTTEERSGFDNFIQAGFVDTFRLFTSEGGHYTWWSYQNQARERNVGWRIDYFVVSQSLVPQVKESKTWPQITGSDHCPVTLVIE